MSDQHSDDWIAHSGGPCPVNEAVTVFVKFRDDLTSQGSRADRWRWAHIGQTDDIIAYRVVKP